MTRSRMETKRKIKNKDRASSSSVKIEEINAVSEEFEDGEILLTSSLDSA